MATPGDEIPTIGNYRGVALHDCQSAKRLKVVRADIDAVHAETDLQALAKFAGDVTKAPEARLFAAAKCRAAFELAAEAREKRPDIDLEMLSAVVAGLDSVKWRNPRAYGSLLDGPTHVLVARETPLPDGR